MLFRELRFHCLIVSLFLVDSPIAFADSRFIVSEISKASGKYISQTVTGFVKITSSKKRKIQTQEKFLWDECSQHPRTIGMLRRNVEPDCLLLSLFHEDVAFAMLVLFSCHNLVRVDSSC